MATILGVAIPATITLMQGIIGGAGLLYLNKSLFGSSLPVPPKPTAKSTADSPERKNLIAVVEHCMTEAANSDASPEAKAAFQKWAESYVPACDAAVAGYTSKLAV